MTPFMAFLGWLADLLGREKFVITRAWTKLPYLTRWAMLGKRMEGRFAAYLHRFQRSDADEMHDHPWPFVSIILAGGYHERTPATGWKDGQGPTRTRWYGPGRVLVRPSNWIHSVVIPEGREAWTLVIRGPKRRSWGFWCPVIGFRPWREHLAATERTGDGCAV